MVTLVLGTIFKFSVRQLSRVITWDLSKIKIIIEQKIDLIEKRVDLIYTGPDCV